MNRILIFAGLLAIVVGLSAPALGQTPTHKPGGFHSPDIAPNASWDLRLNQTGRYHYHCHPHPFMQAEIEVTDSAPRGSVTVIIKDFEFSPKVLEVRPNATIRFTNQGPSTHTVDESVAPATSQPAGGDSPGVGMFAALSMVALVALLARRK